MLWIDHRAFGENLERRRCTCHSDVEVLGVHQVSLRDDHMVVLQALSEQGGTDDVGRGTSTPTACALSDLGRGAACRHAAAVRGADDCQLDVVPKLLSCDPRSEEHTSELQSLLRISYAVFCLKKQKIMTAQNST